MFEFGDRLLRMVHRDHRRGRDPVLQRFEQLRLVDVECPAGGDARLGVVDPGQTETHGREQHREVDAELVQAFVEQPRHHGRGAVAGVLRRCAPERLLGDVLAASLGGGHAQRAAHPVAVDPHGPHGRVAADLAHRLAHHRAVFEPVAVRVDHRMAETLAQLRTVIRH